MNNIVDAKITAKNLFTESLGKKQEIKKNSNKCKMKIRAIQNSNASDKGFNCYY